MSLIPPGNGSPGRRFGSFVGRFLELLASLRCSFLLMLPIGQFRHGGFGSGHEEMILPIVGNGENHQRFPETLLP